MSDLRVTVEEVVPNGTVAVGHGVDEEGRSVTFAGDWRPMRDIAEAIAAGEEPVAEVPDWAVLSHGRLPRSES